LGPLNFQNENLGKGAHERNPKQTRESERAEGGVRDDPWLALIKDVRTFYLENRSAPIFKQILLEVKKYSSFRKQQHRILSRAQKQN